MNLKHITILLAGLLLSCTRNKKGNTVYLSSRATVMAAPLLKCENRFFTHSAEVSMKFSLPNATIKYTLDGSDVTNASKTYHHPLVLEETTLIKAKNFHPQFKSATTASLKVVKTNAKLNASKIKVRPAPNQRYAGNGTASLTDHIKGTVSYNNGALWLGFKADSIQMDIDFDKAQPVSKVTVSSISNHGAWIFLPKKITVFSGKEELGTVRIKTPVQNNAASCEFIEIPIKKNTYGNLSLVIYPVGKIPQWHQGKGTLAWFFTDEILVE